MAELRNKHIDRKLSFLFQLQTCLHFKSWNKARHFHDMPKESQHRKCMYTLPTALLKHRGQPQAGRKKLKQQRGAWKPSRVILEQEGNGGIAGTPGTSASLGTCLREFSWQDRLPFLKLLTLSRWHVTPPTRKGLGCGSNHLGRDILHYPSQDQLF